MPWRPRAGAPAMRRTGRSSRSMTRPCGARGWSICAGPTTSASSLSNGRSPPREGEKLPMRIEFKNVNGVRTRVLFAGNPSAYPILLIHGFGISADTWLRNIDALGEDFFVVAPDMVGHGFTDPVDFEGEPPHRQTVDHLVSLIDLYGFQRLCV